ncbi:MAG: hypothetical protein VXZ99_18425 [Pseudomonadota bacterium]|nr:hypothetical protein [Pseudomonadota bacterium]
MNRPRYLPAHNLRELRAGLFLLAPIRRDHCFEFRRQSNAVQEFRLSVEALELVLDIRVDPLQGVAAKAQALCIDISSDVDDRERITQ